jgi:hypothetical protein
LENVVTTLSTLGLVAAHKTSLAPKKNSIIKAVRFMRKYAHFQDAFTFGKSVRCSYSKVENQVPCVLHLHISVIEKVLTLLFTYSLDKLASDEKIKRIKHIETPQSYVNTLDLGNTRKPGHWKCPIKNGDEVGDCSFTDMQATYIEKKLVPIIEKAFTLQESRKDAWIKVVKQMTWVLTAFLHREYFTDEQLIIMGLRLDEWTIDRILLVGKDGMTNYTHLMTSGHIVYYLKYWSSFYRYINQGWEKFNSQYRYILPHNTEGRFLRHAWRIRVENEATWLVVFASFVLASTLIFLNQMLNNIIHLITHVFGFSHGCCLLFTVVQIQMT